METASAARSPIPMQKVQISAGAMPRGSNFLDPFPRGFGDWFYDALDPNRDQAAAIRSGAPN
jgi:hypothetical protein